MDGRCNKNRLPSPKKARISRVKCIAPISPKIVDWPFFGVTFVTNKPLLLNNTARFEKIPDAFFKKAFQRRRFLLSTAIVSQPFRIFPARFF